MKNRRRSSAAYRDSAAYYNNTSIAYETEYYPYPIPFPYEEEPEKKADRPLRQAKRERRELIAHMAKLMLVMGAVFAGCILMMGASASVQEQRVKNSRLREELSGLQSENASVKADITGELSIDYIKNEAMARLNMVEPQDYQIMHISVPKQSYTVSYSPAEEAPEDALTISGLIKFFKGE